MSLPEFAFAHELVGCVIRMHHLCGFAGTFGALNESLNCIVYANFECCEFFHDNRIAVLVCYIII